jgi:hypothetical protein
MTEAVASALRDAGCPPETARRLAQELTIEPPDESGRHNEWRVLLKGHGHGFDVPVEVEDWKSAAWSVAANIAADNAEAHDRATRGEAGWSPFWPLPGRPASRR